MASPLNDPTLEALLDRLHSQSDTEVDEIDAYFARRQSEENLDMANYVDDATHRFFADKMVALDRDKGLFRYQLCRALRAGRVVEAGTSYGVSTLYVAAAVRDNQVENGVVIGTEHEPGKAWRARETFRGAGLAEHIDLREGDFRETLQDVGGPIDFMLIDIWGVARPALERVSPHLRAGAVVECDNTAVDAVEYDDYFEFVNDPANRLRTMTLPFRGGLEMTVRV